MRPSGRLCLRQSGLARNRPSHSGRLAPWETHGLRRSYIYIERERNTDIDVDMQIDIDIDIGTYRPKECGEPYG